MRILNPPNFAVYGVLGSSSYVAAWCNQSAQLLGTSFFVLEFFDSISYLKEMRGWEYSFCLIFLLTVTQESSLQMRDPYFQKPLFICSLIFFDADMMATIPSSSLSLIIDCQSFHAPINKNHNFGSLYLFALFSDYIQTHLRFTLPNRGVHVKGYICITQN